MNWTLELVMVPVSDLDRAKSFYMEQMGFDLIVDHRAGENLRVVQLNPPGSACAIALMNSEMAPGSVKGLHLCVSNIDTARTQLADRGVAVSDVFHFGPAGETPGYDPERADYNSFASFSDPDGNFWLVQEVSSRA